MNADTFRQRLNAAIEEKAKALGRDVTRGEAVEIAGEVFATVTPKKKANEMTDHEWLAALQSSPRFALLDIPREIAACDYWCKKQFKKPPSRARVLSWLNKAERVRAAKAAGATYANGLRPPPPVGPPGWFDWFAAAFAKVGEDDPAHGQLLAAKSCRAFHMLPVSWRARAFAECVAASAYAT